VPWSEFDGRESGWGEVARWLITALLALALALWLGVLANAQATSDEAAQPALERAIASLTEIDALMAIHDDDLATTDGDIELPGFPVDVRADAAAVQTSNGAIDPVRLRAELLQAAAAQARSEGIAAFHDPEGTPIDTTATSSAGLMRRLVDELRVSRHDRWAGLTAPLLVVVAMLVLVLVWLGRGATRLVHFGVAALAAGVIVVAVAMALRLGLAFVGGDDPVGDEARAIIDDLVGAHLRNGFVAVIAGLVLFVPAIALRWFEDRSGSPTRAGTTAVSRQR
jgi:hypothetical protein